MSLSENCHGNSNVIYYLVYVFICLFIYSFIQFTYTLNETMRSSKYAIKWNEYYGIIIWKELCNLSYFSKVWLGKPRQMSKQPASVPRWGPKISRIRNRCVTHSTMSLGVKCVTIFFIILFPDHIIWYLPSQLLGVLSKLQSIINFEYRDSITRAYYNKSKPEVL